MVNLNQQVPDVLKHARRRVEARTLNEGISRTAATPRSAAWNEPL
jgi:hypothetical protein